MRTSWTAILVAGLLAAAARGQATTGAPPAAAVSPVAATNPGPATATNPVPTAAADDADVTTAAASGAADTNAPLVTLRDPFWPPGYTPAPEQPEGDAAQRNALARLQTDAQWPRLTLKGITHTPKGYMAILDGIGLVEPGQQISLPRGNLIYRWQIDDINEEGVQFRRLEVVPAENPVR